MLFLKSRGREAGNRLMNYLIVNLNYNAFGKKSTQAKIKLYLREGRAVYLPFDIKFNADKD